MSSTIKAARRQTDNAHFDLKVHVRKLAVAACLPPGEEPRVLDCFAGENRLWSAIPHAYYYGIDAAGKGRARNVKAKNEKVIPSLDLSLFNVIDLDSYGVPFRQLDLILKNKTLPPSVLVIYTAIYGAIASVCKEAVNAVGIDHDRVYRKCPMLFNKAVGAFWDLYLFNRCGVERTWCVSFSEGTYRKCYGWFVLRRRKEEEKS